MRIEDGCSHGKTWQEDCKDCDKVSFEEISLPMLKRNCQQASAFYKKNPGLVGPSHTADLYAVIAHLVNFLKKEKR